MGRCAFASCLLPVKSKAGTISGAVTLAKESSRPIRPTSVQGFVRRSENSIRPAKRLDPRADMIVFLESTQSLAKNTEEKTATYRIIGESFETPVKPIVAGTKVEIINSGLQARSLLVKDRPDFIPADPINPKDVGQPNKLITISKLLY